MGKKQIDDRFNRFGTVSFTSISKVNEFIDHLEKGSVCGTRCTVCAKVFFPPRADCCSCLSSSMQWFKVGGSGKLITYSRLKYAPVGFEQDLPYCIALLDYGEYKIFGRISSDVDQRELRVGMQMKTVVKTLVNGNYTYVFEKA